MRCRRDGITRSHKLILSEFTTDYTEQERPILIPAFEPGTRELLGFIRFAYDREGLSIGGGLKMANFNASLQEHTLRTGGTTKARDAGQTGHFGEGMKLSALVFRHSGSEKLSGTPDAKLNKMMNDTRGRRRTAEACLWEDVCVVIGAPEKTRNVLGLVFFKRWSSTRFYQYGYNSFTGSATRDRTSLSGANEESRRDADIRAAAIREDTSDNSDILTEYTQLILKSLSQVGDALLSRERNTLKEDIAEKAWAHLLLINQTQNRNAFYYGAKGKDDEQIIKQSLNMNPVSILQELWGMLCNFGLFNNRNDEDEVENMADAGPVLGGSSRSVSPPATNQRDNDLDYMPMPTSASMANIESGNTTVRQDSSMGSSRTLETSAQPPPKVVPCTDLHTLGDWIDQKFLTESRVFPRNYDFDRVHDIKDDDVYVVKYQRQATQGQSKRP
ncbi:hypothetical protein BU25DRAFT_461368 [Macroventuria anomochaeta]|uniref:Uncharacterized protein n=1 Tax=Macroventuria anomochaeta TaxID=301207 RepID=A0ACB6RQU4_9PLEO|nr:uncharacterized protein BU25DRAFT_461368 [Macroventuria anomochaeta]KAF2624183.1 hypothetical protein BU25DRAFT_461368 [Macroventuria anomochaeta]